jgi:hypothetical protein
MRPEKKQRSRSRSRISARRAMVCKLKAKPDTWCSTLPPERNRRSRPKSLIARAHLIPPPSRLRNQTGPIKRRKNPPIILQKSLDWRKSRIFRHRSEFIMDEPITYPGEKNPSQSTGLSIYGYYLKCGAIAWEPYNWSGNSRRKRRGAT